MQRRRIPCGELSKSPGACWPVATRKAETTQVVGDPLELVTRTELVARFMGRRGTLSDREASTAR